MTDTTTGDVDHDGITGQYDIDDTPGAGTDVALAGDTDDGQLEIFNAPVLQARPLSVAREALHDHVAMMRDAFTLADGVCYTSAVPDRYRGKPKEAAAAIMYGASVGITDPMVALQKVINVHGTPGLEARSMKGILESRGYRFRVTERSATRFRIEAWAPDSNKRLDPPDEVSEWTIERAQLAEFCPTIDPKTGEYRTFNKKSGGTAVLGNMKYITQPTEMLEAKGTAEVCRAVGSSVLMGLPYAVEELRTERWADDDDDDGSRAEVSNPVPQRARGTDGLRERAKRARKPKAEPREEPQDAEVVPVPEPAAPAPAATGAAEPTPAVPDQPPADTSPAPPKADVTAEQANVEAAIDNGDIPVVTYVSGTTGEDLPGPGTPEPVPSAPERDSGGDREATAAADHPAATADRSEPQTPAADGTADLEMTPAVRSKGEDLVNGLLINGGITEDEYRPDALSEVAAKRPGATYRRITNLSDLSNAELKFIVDTLRAWKTKGQLEAWLAEAVNNASLREAGMLGDDT